MEKDLLKTKNVSFFPDLFFIYFRLLSWQL